MTINRTEEQMPKISPWAVFRFPYRSDRLPAAANSISEAAGPSSVILRYKVEYGEGVTLLEEVFCVGLMGVLWMARSWLGLWGC